MRRRRGAHMVAVIVAVAAVLVSVGCKPGTVDLSFRPRVGDTYVYEATISSVVTTQLGDDPPETVRDEAVVRATQTVLDVGPDGVRVQVTLSRRGAADRTFVVRFDRAAQLVAVESVEGIPSEALGQLGLSDIFPAAAGAPPSGPLAPGDRWQIEDAVELPDSSRTQLDGEGVLVELGVEDGHDTATLSSRSSLPLSSSASSPSGTRTLDGVQTTDATGVYDLADGSVRTANTVTVGEFALVLGPPEGQGGAPITGTLTVEVRSSTRRVA